MTKWKSMGRAMKGRLAVFIRCLGVGLILAIPGIGCTEQKDEPPFIGKWQSPKDGELLEFFANGKVTYETATKDAIEGTWKLPGEGDQRKLYLDLKGGSRFRELIYEVTEGKRLTMTYKGKTKYDLERVETSPDPSKLSGRWRDTYKEGVAEQHFLTVRLDDGTGFAVELYIDHERKIYARDEYPFRWKVLGALLVQVTRDEEGEIESLFGSVTTQADKLSFKPTGELVSGDEELLEEVRATDLHSPASPKGYRLAPVEVVLKIEDEE